MQHCLGEKNSGTTLNSYEDTIAKAISNTVDILRLLKMYMPELNKIYSQSKSYIVLPLGEDIITFKVHLPMGLNEHGGFYLYNWSIIIIYH